MDGLIARFDSVEDGDLVLCRARGVAHQRDMSFRAPPGMNAAGENYWDHYAAMEGGEIGLKIHDARRNMVDRHVGAEAVALDVGVGSGQFIRFRPNTMGIDVNPRGIEWLRREGKLAGGIEGFDAYTFWDVLEHVDQPYRHYFRFIADGAWLFTSLPIFTDLDAVRGSKHYKPGEHLYYWTEAGFVEWMAAYRFRLVERSDVETEAGREGVVSFAFRRDLPDYNKTLDQYREMHSKAYGTSAHLHFDLVAREVLDLQPQSIIDWGCGRSDLVAHFWNEGRRRIAKYDPAIPQFKELPDGRFDLALCCDVMEHILLSDVERVLQEIKTKAGKALFTISLRLARAKLPDGRNAHVTLLTASEWARWIKSVFVRAYRVDTGQDHLLMIKTFTK